MSIDAHAEEFAGLPVVEYQAGTPLDNPAGVAHRLSIDYDAGEGGATIGTLLEQFLDDPGARHATALVFGAWEDICTGDTTGSAIIGPLAAAGHRLPNLRALFLADVLSEESEISWIQQGDVGPLLTAYPGLEVLRVRGGIGLGFGCHRHDGLRTLIVESGGISSELVQQIAAADLPNLTHLELWLGTNEYGGDSTVEDLAPILTGERLPKLTNLGLRNSRQADEVAAAVADAAILERIEVLDLSLGNLTDEGAVALMAGGNLRRLKRLDIHHHYISDEALDGLKALGVNLDDSDRREADEYAGEIYRYNAVSE